MAWVVIWDLIETAHSSIGRAEDCSIVCSSSLGHVFKSHWADSIQTLRSSKSLKINKIFNIFYKMNQEKYIDQDYIFYCGLCHQMKSVEHRVSIYEHLHQCKKENGCKVLENDNLFGTDDIPKYIEKISNTEYGTLILVYDLGRFIFEYFDLIKNKFISILQVPHYPIPDETPPRISLIKLEQLDNIKRIYPSENCNTSYPCQHSVKIQTIDGKWYQYENLMRGDRIWKGYARYLPRSIRNHFCIYDSIK